MVYRWRWRSLANKYRLRHSVIKSTKHGSTSLALASRPFVMDLTVCMDISRNPGPNNVAYVRAKLNIVHNFTCGSSSTLRSDDFDYNHSRLSSYNNVIGNCVESWPLYFGFTSHAYNSFGMGLAGTYTQEIPSTSSIPVIIRERPAIITKPVIRARNNLLQISLNRSPSNCQQNPKGPVKFCVWNCQSVRNKTACLVEYISSKSIDIIGLTETWFNEFDAAVKAECIPNGYKLLENSRLNRRGGGVALVFRNNISARKIEVISRESFEVGEYVLTSNSWRVQLAVVYRPPSSCVSTFLDEFATYVESLIMCLEPILITGDFNFHVDNSMDLHASAFLDLLDSLNLEQHVHSVTQVTGHTLDFIITRKMDNIIECLPVSDCFLSDHSTVLCDLNVTRPSYLWKKMSYRKLKGINMELFKEDLRLSDLCQQTPEELHDLTHSYNTTLKRILDRHAPLRVRSVVVRPRVPWFTNGIREAKRERRKTEQRWRTTNLDVDFQRFRRAKNRATYLMNRARSEFYSNLINENSGNQRKLFSITRKLFNQSNEMVFPPNCNMVSFADDMGTFFIRKITNLRAELACVDDCTYSNLGDPCVSSFEKFEPLEMEAVKHLVLESNTKSCSLDPIPTSMVKECLDELLPVLTSIINNCLSSGIFPDEWKEALIIPLLKRFGLDLAFENFRPISNLQFVSKLTEKAVFNQTHSYLVSNDLFPLCQSSYRKYHSTETALLKVKNDILMNMNNQEVTLLVLLDLSAAFDTVDHSILLKRLQEDFGISGTVLSWFSSYLSGRSQKVVIEGVCSKKFDLSFGVPQGSCLGPLLFILYTSKLFKIIESHLPNAHCFADDTQLYLSFKPGTMLDEANAVRAMEACIAEVHQWMLSQKLKLNPEKTEFMVIGTRQQLEKVNIDCLQVGDRRIMPSSVAKNLGSWFDSKLNMSQHINKTCSSAFFHLYNIRRIRKYLTRQDAECLVHALISSKIDYCNGLLYGIPAVHITKLQRVQNNAARLVTGISRFSHITPVLDALHWLPVSYRIQFKILLLTFKCIHGLAPKYLMDLINIRRHTRYSLRSCGSLTLLPPTGKCLTTLGGRAFKSAAPKLWNVMPANIRNMDNLNLFKKALKTYLFRMAFEH